MKSCFVLWSAGLDSTYLIVKLLNEGYAVHSGYVEISRNDKKTKMELAAIAKMLPMIKEKFKNFHYYGTIYKASVNYTDYRNLKYRQVPYFIHAFLIAPNTDFRALGYVHGDSSIKNIEKIRAVYNSNNLICNYTLPKLVFPLKKTTKLQILQYMKYEYPEIYGQCVWCENPTGPTFYVCAKCSPCRRRIKELEQYYLKQMNHVNFVILSNMYQVSMS